ncbi:MAG TPA: xanthine dehydrogenase family protein molybdopterin-binding subunit [Stellaceae bacterium]|jgi:CO/xanthine dehydrogenase Mo-binding subunit|nr:xanthine dehydrogenase family protein molybdopterin-binding subunit [Stellaceae bacterium]
MAQIGRSVRRIEDRPLLTGAGRFAADVSFPDMLHMRVVRSPVAFGRLSGIDTAAASAHPDAAAIWTGADVADIPPIDFRLTPVPGLEPYRQPILAQDYVRYVGEPVGVVFAADPYTAEDIADLVVPQIEPLPPLLDPTAPPGEFAPGLGTEAAVIEKHYGDLEAAFAAAHAVVSLELTVGRHAGVPLESRGAIAVRDDGTRILRMYGAAKVPHYNRRALAAMLGLELDRIHLHEGHVGGGFGIRGELYPEDVLVCLAALQLGRPVRWIEDRWEHLVAANQSRGQFHRVRAAVDERGFILGLDDEFWFDQGGYIRTHGVTVSDLTAAMLPGPYVVPAYRSVGHVRLTNKTPCGTYRAPGRFESSFVRERLVDAIAHRLGLDPVTERRVNLIPKSALPFRRNFATLGTDVTYDTGDYAGLLDKVLDRIGWAEMRADAARRRENGEMVGLGLGFFVEKSGLGPFDDARIELHGDGSIEVVTGAASIGQGVETVMAQICADGLGIGLDRIRVIHGQTDRIERGMGAFASRVTVMTGAAVTLAAEKLKAKILAVAAPLLQTAPERLSISGDRIVVRDAPAGPSLDLVAVASAGGGKLSAEATFTAEHMTYPYGIHLAQVRVEPDTCRVVVERFVVGYDIGRAVNPMLVEGQIAGGAAQGIGAALLEEFVYDETGQPLSVTFADYLMPTIAEIPPIDVIVTEDTPTPLNPLGVKGAGEAGINAAGAAIAAAVDDALGRPDAVRQLPITPNRLHGLLTDGRRNLLG